MQLVMVRAVPFNFGVALCATIVENNGESAMTTIPQNKRNRIKKVVLISKSKGESKQQMHEANSAVTASREVPSLLENTPANTHPKLPIPTMINDQRGTLISAVTDKEL